MCRGIRDFVVSVPENHEDHDSGRTMIGVEYLVHNKQALASE